ncbi:unnamed protein product [Arctia plantaginis]|uniref:Uncharacterized protein n=1 Tax=Arctia plantaginis TaxID=874455 RepID=A0A8S0ZPW8_ARCPL|nr:unnamed protein product [Arctia plantaginis]
MRASTYISKHMRSAMSESQRCRSSWNGVRACGAAHLHVLRHSGTAQAPRRGRTASRGVSLMRFAHCNSFTLLENISLCIENTRSATHRNCSNVQNLHSRKHARGSVATHPAM